MNRLPIIVIELSGVKCELTVLVDTGIPLSFIKPRALKSCLADYNGSLELSMLNYKSINNIPVKIKKMIKTTITLSQLAQPNLPISLHVFETNDLVTDIIIGRNFLDTHEITAVYNPRDGSNRTMALQLPEWLQEIAGCVSGL